MSSHQFETHVYATVRVKVLGTSFDSNPEVIANKVADAVCAKPSQWMTPVHGSVIVDGQGAFDIGQVEFADAISGILVTEIDSETGRQVGEHEFDELGNPLVATTTPVAKSPEVLLVTLSNGDVGLFVNSKAVLTLDASESGADPADTAEQLAEALGVEVTFVTMDPPEGSEWSWADVYDQVPRV